MLTGPLPSQMQDLSALAELHLDENFLSGELPDMFENLTQLFSLRLHSNRFKGPIPNTLWNQNSWITLQLHNNDLTGTAPETICDTVSASNTLTLDDSSWFADKPKVNCSCCGEDAACHMWDITRSTFHNIECPASNIYAPVEYFSQYWVTDHILNSTLEMAFNEHTSLVKLQSCLSPTGCYEIEYFKDSEAQVSSTRSSFNFSFSETIMNLSKDNGCGTVHICGLSLDANHPKRSTLNHITQIAFSNWNDTELFEYEALCWILNDDTLLDNYSFCDGSIIERYILASFYYSVGLSRAIKGTQHTCQWDGVLCDPNEKFVQHLNLKNSSLAGTLITSIGLLRTLEAIDLSFNNLSGTIDASIFRNLPDLTVVNLAENQFEGEIPADLLEMPSLKEVTMFGNRFKGTIPNDIKYSKRLGA